MIKVKKILDKYSDDKWEIEKPEHGSKKECYIASSGDKKVFIKFDINIRPLERLSSLQIAPKILFSGEYEYETYVIQDFIDGVHPDREWIRNNYSEVAKVVNKYHSDHELTLLLDEFDKGKYNEYLNKELRRFEDRLNQKNDSSLQSEEFINSYKRFRSTINSFSPVTLVPTHDEPNTSNMLIKDKQVIFIDWDDLRLTDPMRDIGPILWWYLPQESWRKFMEVFDISLDDTIIQKIYWF